MSRDPLERSLEIEQAQLRGFARSIAEVEGQEFLGGPVSNPSKRMRTTNRYTPFSTNGAGLPFSINDAGARAAYSADASNYRHVPIGVVLPKSVDDVLAAVALCRDNNIPIVVFSIREQGNLARVLAGEGTQTIVKKDV